MPDSVSAACRVIRIGTFKFINAPNSRASKHEQNASSAKTSTDLADNLHLHPHHFTIKLPSRPEIQVDSSEIRQIFTFFGRELPRALICVLVTPRLAESVTAALVASGCKSVNFRPASRDAAEKFIVLFPSDESSFEFQLLGDKFEWFSKRISLRTHEARELVLATAGRKKTVSFLKEADDNDAVEDEKESKVKEERIIKKGESDEGIKSAVNNERIEVIEDKVKCDNKNEPVLLSPIFATPGAVKLLTRRELDHLALARAGKSVLRKRENEDIEDGRGKIRRSDEEGDYDSLSDHREIFTVALCDIDKNGMYLGEDTSEVVIENTGDQENVSSNGTFVEEDTNNVVVKENNVDRHFDQNINTNVILDTDEVVIENTGDQDIDKHLSSNRMYVEEDSDKVLIETVGGSDDIRDNGVYFEGNGSEVEIENTEYVSDIEYGVLVEENHNEVVIDNTNVEVVNG